MYKVRIMITIFQGWPRKIPESYTLVAGFLICQYTFQYTSCILRVTGRILGGTWKVCIRNFTVVVEFLLVQATRVSIQYAWGILNVVYKGCVLISYISDLKILSNLKNTIFIDFVPAIFNQTFTN